MKLKKGFKLRSLGHEFILTPEGNDQINFNKMIALNATAAYLWEKASAIEEFTAEDLVGFLLQEYDVDEETARQDSESIINKWKEADIAIDF